MTAPLPRPAGACFYFVKWEEGEEWDIVELVADDRWFSAATTAIFYDDDFAEIGHRVQTPEEIAAAIEAARAEGFAAGSAVAEASNALAYAAGVEAMREACAQCVEDVEGDAGPMTVATRIRALVILE